MTTTMTQHHQENVCVGAHPAVTRMHEHVSAIWKKNDKNVRERELCGEWKIDTFKSKLLRSVKMLMWAYMLSVSYEVVLSCCTTITEESLQPVAVVCDNIC